jgi:polyphenol oxidase
VNDAHWLVPDWPAPANVRAVCSTRLGGVSAAPFDSMNLGAYVGDAPQAVAQNKALLEAVLGDGVRAVWNRQVHGVIARTVDGDSLDEAACDASITAVRGVACTANAADCLPVLFCDSQGRAVGAAHAGWRGLAAGVLEEALKCLKNTIFEQKGRVAGVPSRFVATNNIADEPVLLLAWLGPCIGPSAFEVGPEVRAAFVQRDPAAAACFRSGQADRWMCDLAGLARLRLQAAGVLAANIHGNDSSQTWCTVGNPKAYFSHRRDGTPSGGTGRMAAAICLL